MVYIDIINIVKVIIAIITIIITFSAGIIELRLNSKNWLNRWFALFFLSASLGFLAYTIYHLITCDGCEPIIISIMIPAQIFFNFIHISLIMTVFILEKSTKIAMSLKYLGTLIALFILMSFGYFIWKPWVDPVKYAQGIVDTKTDPILQIFVNLLRIVLAAYVVYKYAMITRKTEGETKKRIQWFFVGVFIVIVGLIINLVGGLLKFPEFEILALILFNIGAISIVKGFFM
jgi:hypothetical protein